MEHRRGHGVRLAMITLALVVAAGVLPGAALEPTPTGASAGSASRLTTAAVAGSNGIGDAYWPLDGNGGIDVLHYDIRNSYDLDTGRLTGRTVVTIKATQALSSFHLDFLLPVSSVLVDGDAAGFARPHPHELRITPSAPLARGEQFAVDVTYAGDPGSVRYAGERNWVASEDEVVTMNEPHMAPWWFPANDHPTDKARFDITITGPASHQVVSNGLLVDRTVDDTVDGGLATTHWRSRDPMVPYLAFFALGRYDIARGTRAGLPWYVAVSQELPRRVRTASMASLKRSAAITAWLEGRLGRYPFESTGGLATSLPIGFALENQTRPTYASYSATDRSIVVHELAHQWFGDSVSVRRWRDIWLNEGFASFMEVAYAEKHRGPSAERWLQARYRQHAGGTALWRLDLTDPGPRRIFDSSVYLRGAMALQALRQRVGDRAFWSTLRTWVRERRYGNGSVADFQRLAESTSGEQLDGFFRAWLRAPRPPARTRANGLR